MTPDYTVLHWIAPTQRPEDGRYLLLKCKDEDGNTVCDYCAYENGRFYYIYDREAWGEVNEDIILGWAYLPFDS